MKSILALWFISTLFVMTGCATNTETITENTTSESQQAVKEVAEEEKPAEDNATDNNAAEESESPDEAEHEFPRMEVPLVNVIDGDTIKVMIDGKEENIRYLLVDTPETNHPRMDGPQPFGPEAKKFMEEFVEGGTIEIEMDVSERDHYGRILAYVYVDGVSAQEELLRHGLARVAYIYPPNTRYVDQYQTIQEKAQAEAIGIWSVENYAQEDGFYPEHVDGFEEESSQEENNAENCTVKGNISSSGEKIYHVVTGAFYDRTIPEECFNTEKEAEAAGFRKSKR